MQKTAPEDLANATNLHINEAKQRIPAIDALRVLALGLLIFYHLGMAYVPDWGWHVKSQYQAYWLQNLMLWSNQWRMSLLFTISGMATAIMLLRHTSGRVAKIRLWHLGVPLLAGLFFWVAPQVYVELKGQGHLQSVTPLSFYLRYINPFGDLPHSYIRLIPTNWTWNHLWFLPYMLCYCLLAAAINRWLPLRIWQSRSKSKAPAAITVGVLLIIPTCVYWLIGEWLYSDYPVNFLFVGDWFCHASYGFSFALGVVFIVMPKLWQLAPKVCWWVLAMAIGTFALILLKLNGLDCLVNMPKALNGLLWSANRWLWLLAILGFGARYLNKNYYWLKPLRHRVFCYYILHQTIIVVSVYALKDKGWYLAEPLIVLAMTGFVCEAGYQIGSRNYLLGYLLGIFRQKE